MQLLVSLLILAHTTACEFTNPGTQNEVLILGQPLNVTYRGIKYQNYSIALWQQFPKGGGAILGPAIYGTFRSPLPCLRGLPSIPASGKAHKNESHVLHADTRNMLHQQRQEVTPPAALRGLYSCTTLT